MSDPNARKPKLNNELIEKLMAEAKVAEQNVDRVKEVDAVETTVAETSIEATEKTIVETTEKSNDEISEDKPVEVTEETADTSDSTDDSPETKKDKENSKENKHVLRKVLIAVGVLVFLFIIGVGVTYYIESKKYETVFFPNTYINNVDVSYKTPQEVKNIIKDFCKDYEITVKSRYRNDEQIKASDVNLEYKTGDEINEILNAQEPIKFYFVQNQAKEYDIPTMLALDENKLNTVCSSLSSFDDTTVTKSENAYIGDYDPKTSEYTIVSEKNGNTITDKNKAVEYIKQSILNLEKQVDLEDIGDEIYPVAEITSENAKLSEDKKKLDRFVKTKITFTGSDLVLDGNTIKDWLITDADGVVTVDEDKLKEYVTKVAETYDTVGTTRPLKSWYGNESSVTGGTFGWLVDQEAEFEELKAIIPESAITEREPVFSKRGISFGENDWGDTYVEINLAKQHLFFIKEGKLVVESDLVSGGLQRKAGTPEGVYCINYMSRNAVLRGPRRADGSYSYESPVQYWMPFNKGIGLHDASWRGSFGGNIYKYNGSHGCVNLPRANAKTIYENISVGVPVIVYDDDFEVIKATESESETEKESETKAKKKTETKKKTPAATQAATEAATQPSTEAATQSAGESEAPSEIGPGVGGGSDEQNTGGPGASAEPEVTYNAENVPGGT